MLEDGDANALQYAEDIELHYTIQQRRQKRGGKKKKTTKRATLIATAPSRSTTQKGRVSTAKEICIKRDGCHVDDEGRKGMRR